MVLSPELRFAFIVPGRLKVSSILRGSQNYDNLVCTPTYLESRRDMRLTSRQCIVKGWSLTDQNRLVSFVCNKHLILWSHTGQQGMNDRAPSQQSRERETLVHSSYSHVRHLEID